MGTADEDVSRPDDVALLRRVLRAFGVPGDLTAVERVGRAWSNRVWSVGTTHGRYAIKELLNPWGDPFWREWLEAAIAFERKAIEAGVHSPAPVLAPDGAALVTVDGRPFRAHQWIANATHCPDRPVPAQVAESIARDLATMHELRVTPSRNDVFPTPTAATCDDWPDLVEDLRRRHSPYADAALSASPSVALIRDWFARRPAGGEDCVMSHGDVDQKNLLLTDDAPRLVDWDVAAPWVPAEEAIRTALSLASWCRPSVARAFLAGYASAGGVAVEPGSTLLAHDLRISLDWLARCLRIASGIIPAPPQRLVEAREQAAAGLIALPKHVAIARDLPGWLSAADPPHA